MSKKLKGDPLERKKIRKKSHNAEKLKGGILWGFSTSIVSQNIKQNLRGKIFIFGKKSQCRKKTERGTVRDFPTSILTQNSMKLKAGPFEEKISKKSLAVPKKIERGTLWSCPVWYVTRKNRKNLFGSVRLVHEAPIKNAQKEVSQISSTNL